MKHIFVILFLASISITWKVDKPNNDKPHVAFSFDGGGTYSILSYENEVWNSMIKKQLKDNP